MFRQAHSLCAIVILGTAIIVELSDCVVESVCRHVLLTTVTVSAIKLNHSYQLQRERERERERLTHMAA